MSEQMPGQEQAGVRTLEALGEDMDRLNKRLDVIDYFRPEVESAKEQRRAFLAGEIDTPMNSFPLLEQTDFSEISNAIALAGEDLENLGAPAKYAKPYERQIEHNARTVDLLTAAKEYNLAEHDEGARRRFMEANVELFGEPKRQVFEGLVEKLRKDTEGKELSGRADEVRQELLGLLPGTEPGAEAFAPSDETVEWTNNAVDILYEDFLATIPDKETFSSAELGGVFETMLRDVIGPDAEEWRVVLSDKVAFINVSSSSKEIKVPNDKEYSRDKVRELSVHEIGVHALRSIMGDGKNISVLKTGMAGYTDSEEGLAVVFEQALNNKYTERGVPYYLAAGLEYFEDEDFRGAFEVVWRRNALDALEGGEELTDEKIGKARETAYAQVFRINRGTNNLPWFKDLTYYNGNMKMWKCIEENKGDPELLFSLFQGKIDPEDMTHMRAVWDAELVQRDK